MAQETQTGALCQLEGWDGEGDVMKFQKGGDICIFFGLPGGSEVKVSAPNTGDLGWIPGSGRSPGEGNGNPLQYSHWRIPWIEEPSSLQSM